MAMSYLAVVLAQFRDDDRMSGGEWAMMIVFATLFAALLATAIWALITYVGRASRRHEPASPLDVLAERYARGEISTDEYQERLANLRGRA